VKYQQDDKFGALDLIISNNGYKLTGKYYQNDGGKKDEFSISKSGTYGSKYNFGPSLTLSGQDVAAKNEDSSAKHLWTI
jgi:hypothetical protein